MAITVPDIGIHRLSIADYHRMVASGGFDETTHVELIDGLLLDMSSRSPAHEYAVRWLAKWLNAQLDRRKYELLVTGPLTIGNSEPEPDLSVIDEAPLGGGHPRRARLVIKVALTSHARDLTIKPAVYACAVDEYWVVDLDREVIVIHRDPAQTHYLTVTEVPAGQPAKTAAIELPQLDTTSLFAAAAAGR